MPARLPASRPTSCLQCRSAAPPSLPPVLRALLAASPGGRTGGRRLTDTWLAGVGWVGGVVRLWDIAEAGLQQQQRQQQGGEESGRTDDGPSEPAIPIFNTTTVNKTTTTSPSESPPGDDDEASPPPWPPCQQNEVQQEGQPADGAQQAASGAGGRAPPLPLLKEHSYHNSEPTCLTFTVSQTDRPTHQATTPGRHGAEERAGACRRLTRPVHAWYMCVYGLRWVVVSTRTGARCSTPARARARS